MRPNQPDERYLGSVSDFTFSASPEDRKIVRKIQEDYARKEGKKPVMAPKDGRVGGGHGMKDQRSMTATAPPLVKPDVQISRIRLSQDILVRSIHR